MKLTKKVLASAAAIAIAGSIAVIQPAQAAQTGDTAATFEITAGTLDITVPASTVDLGSAASGPTLSQLSGDLGTVTVTDNRGALVAAWVASASSTNFTTGTATTEETVSAASISYAANGGAGNGGGAAPVFAFPGAASLGVSTPVASLAAGVGINDASWTANLTFTLLPDQVAGVYSGTVTHSVV